MSNLQKLVMGNKGVNLQKMYSCKKKIVRYGVMNLTQFYFVK